MSDAYRQAVAADDAWHAELIRIFGRRNACNIRYLKASRGDPGSNLRTLHDARERANERWNAERQVILTRGCSPPNPRI